MRFFLLLLVCLPSLLVFPCRAGAQIPQNDIRPLLKSLTPEQKQELLAYLRHLGAEIDDEIQHAYGTLSRTGQLKSADFLKLLKLDVALRPTTAVNWNRDTINFGEIPEGNPVIDSFVVTNTGDQPYLISNYQTTCDCTVLDYPEHPVMPGEKAVLRVEFDTRAKAGTAKPAIILYDNSAPNKRSMLFLKGRVLPRKLSQKKPWDD